MADICQFENQTNLHICNGFTDRREIWHGGAH